MEKVVNRLYRGPRPKGFKELQKDDIKMVINLQSGIYEGINTDSYEFQVAESFGMVEKNIYCSDFLPPTMDQVALFLNFVLDSFSRGQNVYVHCLHGKDRTGFMIACFRMYHSRWTAKQAIKEMREHGFHIFPYAFWIVALYRYEKALRERK